MHALIDARPLQGATGLRGVGGYVRLLAAGLLEHDPQLRVSLLCDPRRPPPVEPPESERSEVVWISAPPGPGLLWGRILGRSMWRKHRADVFHATFLSPPRLPADAPWLSTIHDLIPLRHPNGFSRRQRFVFEHSLRWASKAPRVVTVSRFTASLVQQTLGVPAARIEVLPPPIDVARFQRAPSTAVEASVPNHPFLLHSGGFDPLKGVDDLLLPAFARLSGENRDLLLVMTGEGPRQREVARAAKELGLGSRVTFAGHVDAGTHAALVQKAQAVVVSSREEGFGMPVIEAMAAGTPVAIGPAQASCEAGGGLAVLASEANPEGMARAMRGALEQTDEASANQRRAWAARFAPAKVAAQMHDIYASLVEGRVSLT